MTTWDAVKNDSRFVRVHEHGFVGLLDTMGSDTDIANAARVSYGTGTKSVNDDRNLIRYLVRHKHTSPLEMAEVKFMIKCPLFVMRQLVRHRTASLNEYSGRYSVMSDEFYVPTEEYVAPQSTTNKQGRAGIMTSLFKTAIIREMKRAFKHSYTAYSALLGPGPETTNPDHFDGYPDFLTPDYPGLSRELARTIIPVSNYTEVMWKCDLHNFFHFARLRMDGHAQREIRDFATAMYELAKPHFPLAAHAFEDYVRDSVTLSAMDLIALKDMLDGIFKGSPEAYGMSKREYAEFTARFPIQPRHVKTVA
jgi:thymidylate synthase (FAD)